MNISGGGAMGKVLVGRVAVGLLSMLILFAKAHAMTFIEVTAINKGLIVNTVKYVVRDFPIDDPTPAPARCINSGCTVGVAYWFRESSGGMFGNMNFVSIPRGTMTIGDIARIYRKKYPQGTVQTEAISALNGDRPCIGMAIEGATNGKIDLLPGSLCNKLDFRYSSPNACYIDGTIELHHGVVARDMLNNHVASTAVNVRCLQPATVKMTMLSPEPGSLWLNNSRTLRASIFLDGEPMVGGMNIQIPGGRVNKSIGFSSTLTKVSEVEAGSYSASSVIVLDIL